MDKATKVCRWSFGWTAAWWLSGWGHAVFADESGSSAQAANGIGWAGTVFQLIGYLALILILFFVLIKGVARIRNRLPGGRAIRTLGGVPFGPNKSLQLVEIGRVVYVIGVGEDVRLIDKISDPEEVELLREALAESPLRANAWLSLPLFKRDREKPDCTEAELAEVRFRELFEAKLRGLSSRKELVERLSEHQTPTHRSDEDD